ncbi:MAG TPA: hypothetical protein VFN67_21575 [Polyangiales bacterium]|nr:hypothetical protein [Polyangiales bacterium]
MAQLQPMNQEAERVRPVATLSITAWVVLFGVLLSVVAALLLFARNRTLTQAESATEPTRPEPEVSHVRSELFRAPGAAERLNAQQRQKLAQFGWVDRERQLVHIPIDLAMDLEAQGAQP